jgi:hypothetical protein
MADSPPLECLDVQIKQLLRCLAIESRESSAIRGAVLSCVPHGGGVLGVVQVVERQGVHIGDERIHEFLLQVQVHLLQHEEEVLEVRDARLLAQQAPLQRHQGQRRRLLALPPHVLENGGTGSGSGV